MTEKRFTLEQWTEESLYFSDGEYSAHMSIGYICKKVEKKLNEQQATIDSLKEENNTLIMVLKCSKHRFNKLKEEHKVAIDEMITDYKNLEKENEQLRTQLLICQQSKSDDGQFKVWQVPPIKKGMRIISFTTSDGEKDE